MQGHLYDGTRPFVRYSVPKSEPQTPHQNYPPSSFAHPRWDARHVPAKQSSNFVVPPPGVIFPSQDWAPPPSQDTYWPKVVPPADAGLAKPPSSSLLLSPCSPPHASSPLKMLPSPPTAIVHGQPSHSSVLSTGTGPTYGTAMVPPPPRYREVAHTIPPRLAEAGRQAHPEIGMSPPRRSGHDALPSTASPYTPGVPGPGPGYASLRRGPPSSEEMTVVEGRGRYSGPSYGPGDRTDLALPSVPNKYEYYEREEGAGRPRTAWPQVRERRPSVWRRFVRRFSLSVGQT